MLHPPEQGCYNAGFRKLREIVVLKSLSGLIAVVMLSLAAVGQAEVVRDLHTATVPVSSQSSSALARASEDALAEVLVKVSGSAEAALHPMILEALSEARSHVQQYAYVRGEGDDRGLYARFEFDGAYVNRLLTEARLPLWTANRPRVLVWMAVEQGGERKFVSPVDTPLLAAQLVEAFARRGVPAQLPLFDLSDATALTVEDVWNQNGPMIQAASARYDVQDVLVGRAVLLSTGAWTGDWSYFHGPRRLDRSSNAPAAAGFLQLGVGMVAEEMASRYAVAPSGTIEDRVKMVVSGVDNFSDYTAIVNWLESLELIEHANIQLISGQRIELGLDAVADAGQLRSIIELNKRLQPVSDNAGELIYQWQN